MKKIDLKRLFLVFLQALSIVLIFACFLVYTIFSSEIIISEEGGESEQTFFSINDLRSDYYETSAYQKNMKNYISDIFRFCVIRSQMEVNGEYDPNKIIYIKEFYHRKDSEPIAITKDVPYRLGDLISWGQYGVSHNYQVFDSWEELNAFFGVKNSSSKNSLSKQVPLLDVVSNRYLTITDEKLENYAQNVEEYTELVECLTAVCDELYSNYVEYQQYLEEFSTDKTNIRYYVSVPEGRKNVIFTNLINYRSLTEDKLTNYVKEMGSYLYVCPGELSYLTNMPLEYDEVKESMLYYEYFLLEDTKVWVGMDTSYSVDDLLYENFMNHKTASILIPWLAVGIMISVATFFIIAFTLIQKTRTQYKGKDAAVTLREIHHMPIEIETLFFALLAALILVVWLFANDNTNPPVAIKNPVVLVQPIIFVFLLTLDILIWMDGVLKRIVCKNIFEHSILRWIFGHFSFIRKFANRIYKGSNVAARTWGAYGLFLLFNVFWALVMFFSNAFVLSFIVLFVFDLGVGIFLFNRNYERKTIIEAIKGMNEGDYQTLIDANRMHGDNKELALELNKSGESFKHAVETSTRDEKLKADLITNVSHDIKTPLTSIINYVDLIKRENIDNERIRNYVNILDEKSQRLKQLTVDLVEASKITSGNITLEYQKINLMELLYQAEGEFEEKYETRSLQLVMSAPDYPVLLNADPRYVWRIVENLLQNVYKYALEGTRVYLDVFVEDGMVCMDVKNISAEKLNHMVPDDLTERFIRGDSSRTTEGSGLGLSIVKSLCKAHNGSFDVHLDGDLFKAMVRLPQNIEDNQ